VEGLGLSGATRRVAEHARSFVELEVQLALAELKKKAQALGTGIGLLLGAAVFAFLALCFGLAAAAAGLSTTLPVWASLLIVCGALILMTAILALVGRVFLQKGSQPVPEQAVEEARLTTEALRNGQGDGGQGDSGQGD
jgi:membrane protein implicated in regulation of membrane protease activity